MSASLKGYISVNLTGVAANASVQHIQPLVMESSSCSSHRDRRDSVNESPFSALHGERLHTHLKDI